MKTIVVFKSKYGSSKQYALWIADALQCKAENVEKVSTNKLLDYDIVVYVGGIYVGGVNGYKQISKHLDALQNKKLVLCMVGITNPAEKEKYKEIYFKNVPEQYRSIVKPFALNGDQFFSKMSMIHRWMMKMPKTMAEKIPVEQRTEYDKQFIENYGVDVQLAKKEYIHDIVDYVQSLGNHVE